MPIAPSRSPQSVAVDIVDSTTAILTWMPPPSAHHNGIIQYYVLNVTEMDTALQIQIESLTTEETISALHPFYTYEVTVSALTVSSGPFSSPVVFQLPEDGMFLYNYR